MNDYIRKAVELAEGWSEVTCNSTPLEIMEAPSGYRGALIEDVLLDALAAQLVRQVDAAGWCMVITTDISEILAGDSSTFAEGPDRTMNTIKAIVDSGVLD